MSGTPGTWVGEAGCQLGAWETSRGSAVWGLSSWDLGRSHCSGEMLQHPWPPAPRGLWGLLEKAVT